MLLRTEGGRSMFEKLYVDVNDAALWHLFDQKVRKEYVKDWRTITLSFMSLFLYTPAAITAIVAMYMEDNVCWFIMLFVSIVGAAWHIVAWNTARYNVYLAKYMKGKKASRELMEILSDEYFPLQVCLYAQKYSFIKGYLENGYLVMEFDNAGVVMKIRGIQYDDICTTDKDKQGLIVLNDTGLTAYSRLERQGGGYAIPSRALF